MSQFREQSFHNSQFNSKESLLPKSDVERIKRKGSKSEARANELRSDGSFSSDIPEKRTQKNNEARKRRAVLAKGVATKQLDQISDAHNRRLSREMRPAGVPTGSGPSHTAEVDALLRGGIPRDAWNSDSVVPGSMDDPKRSTASFESRRGKQIIAVTPDHRRLEDIAAPDFFVSEDDDDDDLFDEEQTFDGENSVVADEEDEYALLAKKYGITLPEDESAQNKEVDEEISKIAKLNPVDGDKIVPLSVSKPYQSGGRNVRLSMDRRRSHRKVTFLEDDIDIQRSQASGSRQDTPQKGKETGRRRHLQALQQQFERGGLLVSSQIPKETKKIVGGSRRIVESVPQEKSVSEPDYRYGYHRGLEKKKSLSDQSYELAIRKTPEILERHNRKQKFLHKILDWDLEAIQERDFSYMIPFEDLDSLNPTDQEYESQRSEANLNFFRTTLKKNESDKRSKVYHELFLILHDFYKSQGDVLKSILENFTDPSAETIKDFEKCIGETTDKFFADLIKKLIFLKKMKQGERYHISRNRSFIGQTEELIEELDRIRNFFSTN